MRTSITSSVVFGLVWLGIAYFVMPAVPRPQQKSHEAKVERLSSSQSPTEAKPKSSAPLQSSDLASAERQTEPSSVAAPESAQPGHAQAPATAKPESSGERGNSVAAKAAESAAPATPAADCTAYAMLTETPHIGDCAAQPVALKVEPPASVQNGNVAKADSLPNPRIVKVTRGDLFTKLSASGTVKPEETVEVFAQVTGMIKALATDPADANKPLEFGSVVHKGDALAYMDATIYQAQVDSAAASLATAKANLVQYEARNAQAQRELKRAQSLLPDNAIAVSEYEQAVTGLQVAAATVDVGKACVQQCEAALRIAEVNLGYTVVRSPIDGVIIDRRVDVGQTVLANFPFTPGMFLIAKDTRRLQVWATIKETEINHIQAGMPVQFTVDSRPGDVFNGKVAQLRLNATRNGNAGAYTIVYTAVIDVGNSKGLLPYLTAKFQFEFDRRHDVLLVPNDALREPAQSPSAVAQTAGIAPAGVSAGPKGVNAIAVNDSAGQQENADLLFPHKLLSVSAQKFGKACRRLFVKSGDSIRPVEVQVGNSDGAMTEVVGENVKEGMEVVLGALPPTHGG